MNSCGKKITAILLVCAMTLCTTSTACATPNPIEQHDYSTASVAAGKAEVLDQLAAQYVTNASDSNGSVIYSNLQEFYSAAFQAIPDLAKFELACYAMEQFRPGELEFLSESEILGILHAQSIAGSISYFVCSADGQVYEISLEELVDPCDLWTSEDGFMQISTYATDKGLNSHGYRQYGLSAAASWLKPPAMWLSDTFAIVSGGTFDSSGTVTATYSQGGRCDICGKTFNTYLKDEYRNDSGFLRNDAGIELDFSQAGGVNSIFDLQAFYCPHATEGGMISPITYTAIRSYLNYQIITDSDTQAAAAYAHKTVGIFNIKISANITGKKVSPSFSWGPELRFEPYSAAAVTLYP